MESAAAAKSSSGQRRRGSPAGKKRRGQPVVASGLFASDCRVGVPLARATVDDSLSLRNSCRRHPGTPDYRQRHLFCATTPINNYVKEAGLQRAPSFQPSTGAGSLIAARAIQHTSSRSGQHAAGVGDRSGNAICFPGRVATGRWVAIVAGRTAAADSSAWAFAHRSAVFTSVRLLHCECALLSDDIAPSRVPVGEASPRPVGAPPTAGCPLCHA